MKSKILVIFILIITSVITTLNAKYEGEFISYSVDARSLALGNLNLTSFNNSSVVYWNPAAMPFMGDKNNDIIISHSERFAGLLQQEFIAFKTNKYFNNKNLGISLIRIGVSDIPVTTIPDQNGIVAPDNRPEIVRNASDNEFAFFVSYGEKYNGQFGYGGSLKLLIKSIDEYSATGIGFDLSGFYEMNEDFKVGAKIQDITTSMLFWSTGTTEIIRPLLLLGTEYNGSLPYYSAKFKIMAGSKIGTENYQEYSVVNLGFIDIGYNVGAEVIFKEVVSLRGGYENNKDWSAGTGIRLFGANLDYAFKPNMDDLGDTHKVSLSYGW